MYVCVKCALAYIAGLVRSTKAISLQDDVDIENQKQHLHENLVWRCRFSKAAHAYSTSILCSFTRLLKEVSNLDQ